MKRMLYVYKSMLNKLQYEWKDRVIFMFAMIMLAAVFFSRVVLSVAMAGFIITCFLRGDIKDLFRNFLHSPLLWGMSLLFMIPLVSGLWSSDEQTWQNILRIKLPLLLLPLAFASGARFSNKQSQWLALFLISLVVAGSFWSFLKYSTNMQLVNEGYLKAKSIVTPLQNDHIRFSWLVSFATLLCGILLWHRKLSQKALRISLYLAGSWFIIYLHLLASRTGLFSLYIMLAGAALWLIAQKTKKTQAVTLLVILLLLPLAAYLLFPTFRNRVKYIYYDYGYFKDAHYLPGGNDAARIISLKAGYGLVKTAPLAGVGFGDIYPATIEWYDTKYPQMQATDKIYPSSEWLLYGAGAGIPGLLLFSCVMGIPFFIKKHNKMPAWLLLNITVAFGFLFDIGLELQFGVFIYSFSVLWCWKWFSNEA